MTRLILVRHGQSIANLEGRFAGHSDFDLSEIGFKQAERVADYLCEREKIDLIYSSDLLRAYNTGVPTAKRLGLEIIPDTRLREIFAGEWEGLKFSEIAEIYPEAMDVWKTDFSNARPTNGESTREVYRRINKTIPEIAKENDGKCILITTHATVVRAFECAALGLPEDRLCDVPFCHNAAINIYEYENGKVTPKEIKITEHVSDFITAVPKEIRA